MIPEHPLPGCTPTPLASYLKALAVLRGGTTLARRMKPSTQCSGTRTNKVPANRWAQGTGRNLDVIPATNPADRVIRY